jgi:hypothetical protein
LENCTLGSVIRSEGRLCNKGTYGTDIDDGVSWVRRRRRRRRCLGLHLGNHVFGHESITLEEKGKKSEERRRHEKRREGRHEKSQKEEKKKEEGLPSR